jgi:hypothetical protein
MNRPLAILSMATVAFASLIGSTEASGTRHRPKPDRPLALFNVAIPEPKEVRGDLCATNARAEADARKKLTTEVKSWLAEAGVDPKWNPPKKLVDRMIIGQPALEPVKVADLDVIRATITADFSEARKHQLVNAYNRQLGGRRLVFLGGGLAVILASLAAVSSYIRADEATKGYYTNRLRLLAAAGVGAAGVLVYRSLS